MTPNIPWESLSNLRHLHQRNYSAFADLILRMKILNDSLKEEREIIDNIIEGVDDGKNT